MSQQVAYYGALIRIVETLQQLHACGLATAGMSHQGHRLTLEHLQVQAIQNLIIRTRWVTEFDVAISHALKEIQLLGQRILNSAHGRDNARLAIKNLEQAMASDQGSSKCRREGQRLGQHHGAIEQCLGYPFHKDR